MLTDAIIFRESGQYDKEVIHRLHLEKLGITRIASLDACVSLMELTLSRNEIAMISGLENLVSLRRLDLSYNRIRKLENLHTLVNLQVLEIRGNLITALQDVQELSACLELQSVFFKGVDGEDPNPFCSDPKYSSTIAKILPQLQVLDGGHMQITSTFRNMEDELAQLNANTACKTPPSEPWFTQKDMFLAGATGDEGDIEAYVNSTKTFAPPKEAHDKIADMLKEECAHLLRKAQSAISKAEK